MNYKTENIKESNTSQAWGRCPAIKEANVTNSERIEQQQKKKKQTKKKKLKEENYHTPLLLLKTFSPLSAYIL